MSNYAIRYNHQRSTAKQINLILKHDKIYVYMLEFLCRPRHVCLYADVFLRIVELLFEKLWYRIIRVRIFRINH